MSCANFCRLGGRSDVALTSRIVKIACRPRSAVRPILPTPTMPTAADSGRARYFAATQTAALVRFGKIECSSMIASGEDVSGSLRMI